MPQTGRAAIHLRNRLPGLFGCQGGGGGVAGGGGGGGAGAFGALPGADQHADRLAADGGGVGVVGDGVQGVEVMATR